MYSIGAATESADATRELLPCLSRPSLVERVSDAATAFGNSGEVQNSCHNYYIQRNDHITKTDPQITIKDRRNQLLYRSYDANWMCMRLVLLRSGSVAYLPAMQPSSFPPRCE